MAELHGQGSGEGMNPRGVKGATQMFTYHGYKIYRVGEEVPVKDLETWPCFILETRMYDRAEAQILKENNDSAMPTL